jgi:hypothetical protein
MHVEQIPVDDWIKSNSSLIPRRYYNKKPLAEIINLPNYSNVSTDFELQEDGAVDVYAVGELIYNLAEAKRNHILVYDNIVLSLARNGLDTARGIRKDFTFSFANVKPDTAGIFRYKQDGIIFHGVKKAAPENVGYRAEIQIPWNIIESKAPSSLSMNVKIGDSEDCIYQNSVIALLSDDHFNSLASTGMGNVHFYGKSGASAQQIGVSLSSNYFLPTMDGDFQEWERFTARELAKVLHGAPLDKFDLSARIKTCWDESNFYLYIDIDDSKLCYMPKNDDKRKKTFVDYGWIEDSHKRTIWNMHVFNSRHAGGAFKNQMIDTALFLRKGRYTLHFTTDESHTFGAWDDDKPNVPFYGIVVYKATP